MQKITIAGNVGKDAVVERPRKTVAELAAILDYDRESGRLTWSPRGPEEFTCVENERTRVASRWNKLRAGKEAGHVVDAGYRVVCIEGKTYQSHRIAVALTIGQWPDGEVDHINHDRTDNSLRNLRVVTSAENSRNRSLPRHSTSGAIGVHFHRPSGKWHARIWAGDKRIHIGSFERREDAEAARICASAENGFHANHGSKGIAA